MKATKEKKECKDGRVAQRPSGRKKELTETGLIVEVVNENVKDLNMIG